MHDGFTNKTTTADWRKEVAVREVHNQLLNTALEAPQSAFSQAKLAVEVMIRLGWTPPL